MTWRYFSKETDPRLFTCSETGEEGIKEEFVDRLDELRHRCDFPFGINSGYRSPRHSKEKDKPGGPGQHSEGHAADVKVADGVQRRRIVAEALKMEFGGIGVAKTFVHVDDRDGQSVMWVYN